MGVEIFSNNSRSVLLEDLSASSRYIDLELGTGVSFDNERPVYTRAQTQRATLFHPNSPGEYEIILISSVHVRADRCALYVSRGWEDTEPRAWPAGTIIEARVTAGMLEGFPHKSDTTSANVTAPDPYAVRYDSSHFIDQGFGRVSVRTTPVIPLGLHESLPVWEDGEQVLGRTMYRRLDVPGKYFIFESEIWGATLPSGWGSQYTFTNAYIDEDDGTAYGGRGTWFEVPVIGDPINMEFYGVGGVITEVGFVCTEGSVGVQDIPPEVFFDIGNGAITKTLPAMENGDVFRIPISPQEGVTTAVGECGAGLLTRTDVLFGGYFYAVMTPLLVEPM